MTSAIVTSLTWVQRGVAKPIPDKVNILQNTENNIGGLGGGGGRRGTKGIYVLLPLPPPPPTTDRFLTLLYLLFLCIYKSLCPQQKVVFFLACQLIHLRVRTPPPFFL